MVVRASEEEGPSGFPGARATFTLLLWEPEIYGQRATAASVRLMCACLSKNQLVP